MEALRIAAHNGAPVWGGAEVALARVLAGLAGRGHQVRLYANHPEVVERSRDMGVDAHRRHLGGDIALHHAMGFAAELRRYRPDALLLGTFRKTWLGALAGRLAGVPRILARIGLATDTPRSAKYRFVFRRWIDGAVFNADGMRRRFREDLPSFAGRGVTIYTGIPAPEVRGGEELRRALGIPAMAPLVGSVGRLAEQKRYDRLIHAVTALDSVHLLVVGEGDRRPTLEAQAREAGVESRIHMPGFRADVGPALDAMDVFVISSDREGMSNAMLEALAAGVPVVSTDVSGAREALEAPAGRDAAAGSRGDGYGPPGIVVPSTSEALAEALDSLLTDPERRAAMSRAARFVARERFGEERMLDEWEGVLAGHTAARSTAPAGEPG